MALFGRRKPGFSKEVTLKPSEIPGEFSDALDPAVNKALDNPKLEKVELQEAAAKVMAGTAATTAKAMSTAMGTDVATVKATESMASVVMETGSAARRRGVVAVKCKHLKIR